MYVYFRTIQLMEASFLRVLCYKKSCEKAGRPDCLLENFSEQSLVDWGKKLSNIGGCHNKPGKTGGTVELGFQAIRLFGIYLSSSYPWINDDEEAYEPAGATRYYKREPLYPKSVSMSKLKEAVNSGPVAVTVLIGETSKWHTWRRFDDKGKPTGIDVLEILKVNVKNEKNPQRHSVLITGYGNYNGENYWLVKNSWGIGSGDYGYIKIGTTKATNSGMYETKNSMFTLVV